MFKAKLFEGPDEAELFLGTKKPRGLGAVGLLLYFGKANKHYLTVY